MRLPVTVRAVRAGLVEVDLGGGGIQAEISYVMTVEGVENGMGGNTGYTARIPFEGVAAWPLPSELGRLQLEGRASGKIGYGGCGEREQGEQVQIRLVPSPAAEPWLRAVSHQLIVDGKPGFDDEMPLVDYLGREHTTLIRAIARCGPADTGVDSALSAAGLELRLMEGKHLVSWTTKLADGKVLATPAVDVDLTCAGAAPVRPPCCKPLVMEADAGAGVSTNDAGAPVDNPDSATKESDGGLAQSPTPASAGAADAPLADEDGCALALDPRNDAGGWLLLSALLMMRTRQRTRRKLLSE